MQLLKCKSMIVHAYHPRSLHFASPHFTSLHFSLLLFTSLLLTSLHCTTLHYTTLHFTSLHFTSLHFTSLHFTSLHVTSLHFLSLHFTPNFHVHLLLDVSLPRVIFTHLFWYFYIVFPVWNLIIQNLFWISDGTSAATAFSLYTKQKSA